MKRDSTKRPETGGRITNETVAEHRERILAGGRKFKYPMQYTKRRIVIISILIVLLSTAGFFLFSGWQLYSVQNTSKFMFGLTQILPAPVAKVEGQWVRYSDYLLELRSSLHYLVTKEAINFNSDDGKRQLEYQKRLALNKAIENAYLTKIARDQKIRVDTKEVDDFVRIQINSNRLGVNEDLYKQVIRDYYDWSFEEYKTSIKKQLLRKKVQAKLDTDARQKITAIRDQLRQGADFAEVAKTQSEDEATKQQGGDIGIVTKDADDPHGLIAAANNLQPSQVSDAIEGVDGFYIVKLIERQGENELRLAKIFIAYKYLDKKISELKQAGQIQEFIKVDDAVRPAT
ncbi:MAG: peptidylprolyl isomerase [Candidatus Saccharimonadales bacterium]